MHVRRILLSALCLSSSLATISCGGAAAESGSTESSLPTASSAPPDVWDNDLSNTLPANTIFYARANLDTLRAWQGWARAVGIFDAIRRRESVLSDEQWRAITTRSHEVVFGGTFTDSNSRQDSEPLLFLRTEDTSALLGPNVHLDRFGFRSMQNPAADYGMAALDERTVFLTDTGHLDLNLERLKGGDFPSIWTNRTMTQMRDALHGENAAASAIFAPPGMFRLVFLALASGELGFDQTAAQAFAGVQGVSGRLDVPGDVQAAVFLDAESEQAAATLVTAFQNLVRGYAGNVAVMLMGVSPILNRIAISANGARVSMQLTVTAAEADSLLSRASLFVGE